MDENDIKDGTDTALWIYGIIAKLKEAAYHVEGITYDSATAVEICDYLEQIDDLTTDLSAVAEDVFDAANA